MTDFFQAYLCLNLIVAAGWVMLASCKTILMRVRVHFSFRDYLRLAKLVLVVIAFVPFLLLLGPPWLEVFSVHPYVGEIWSATSMRDLGPDGAKPLVTAVSLGSLGAATPLGSWVEWVLVLMGLILAVLGYKLAREFQALRHLGKSSVSLRRRGSIRILVSDDIAVPLSYWLPRRHVVLLPSSILANSIYTRIAIAHELQHHRQHDTYWLYGIAMLKLCCFWNPLAYALERWIREIQEFACDEAVAGPRRFSSSAYCRCLLWVAENANRSPRHLVGTASMAGSAAGKTLRRRMEMILARPEKTVSRYVVRMVLGIFSLAMVSIAFAANMPLLDRRITMEDAERLAESARRGSQFPIVVNDLVLVQLNRYLGTQDGRSVMKAALERMETYRPMLEGSLHKLGLPAELLALPIVESQYQNRPEGANPGAGLWQFIKKTGRNWGLRIDDIRDQRLDPPLATDAALRHLGALYFQFQDWGLAFQAYNGGAGLVLQAIEETGSQNVWDHVRAGYENDSAYVAKVMAAVIVLKNPDALE